MLLTVMLFLFLIVENHEEDDPKENTGQNSTSNKTKPNDIPRAKKMPGNP